MKIKIQLLLIVTLSVLLGSCQKDPNSLIEPNTLPMQTSSIDTDSNLKDTLSSDAVKYIAYMMDSSLISEDEALMNLNQLMQRNASKTRNMGKSIKSIHPMYLNNQKGSASKSKNAVAYTVEYENNQGFAIVAADRRIAPIICVVEDGSLDGAYEVPGLSTILSNINLYIESQIARFDLLRDSLKKMVGTTYKKGRGFTGFEPSPTDPDPGTEVDPNTGGGLPDGQLEYYFSGWVEKGRVSELSPVRWDQGDPFNGCTNVIICDGKPYRTRAGCVAIAMAQVMAYYKQPTVYKNYFYDWNIISKKQYGRHFDSIPEIKPAVANLVRTIGSEVNMKYKCDGSSALPTSVRNAFSRMGYSASTFSPYNYDRAHNSLKDKSPVIMFGSEGIFGQGGHCWVVDGYIYREQYMYCYRVTTNSYGEKERTLVYRGAWHSSLLHNNWGWGYGNGYFEKGCFDPDQPIILDDDPSNPEPGFKRYLSSLYNIKYAL